MKKRVALVACIGLAACSGREDGETPQLSPLLVGTATHAEGGSAEGASPAPDRAQGDTSADAGAAVASADAVPAERENLAPELVDLEAESSTVPVHGSTALVARVRDAESDPFHLWWQSSCGIVAPTGADGARAVFLAPAEPGTCTVTLQVQDAELQRTREHTYAVQVLPAAELEVSDDLP